MLLGCQQRILRQQCIGQLPRKSNLKQQSTMVLLVGGGNQTIILQLFGCKHLVRQSSVGHQPVGKKNLTCPTMNELEAEQENNRRQKRRTFSL